jgi:PPOX class probable F420-dependent enzyme
MDVSEALDFVRNHHRGVLATRRADERPQLSVVVAAVDDADRVVISTREPAMKARNIRRDPVVSLLVFTEDFFGPWVQLDGTATVLSLPDAMEPLVDYYRRLSGEHPDWADYRAAMQRDRRVLLQITVAQAGPNQAG